MHHLDEHTIEQFVLGAALSVDRKNAIREHLDHCPGCRELAVGYRSFYADTARSMQEMTAATQDFMRTPVGLHEPGAPAGAEVVPQRTFMPAPAPAARPAILARATLALRHHPVWSGLGGLAVFALAAVLLFPDRQPATEPVFKSFNLSTGKLEFLDEEYRTVRSLSIRNVSRSELDEARGLFKTLIIDVDGDGSNDIVTSEHLPGDPVNSSNGIRVIPPSGPVRTMRQWNEPLAYHRSVYDPVWDVSFLLADRNVENGRVEIFANVSHLARSPGIIARLDPDGAVLGEFLHYGRIQGIYAFDMDKDGRKEIFAVGVNDTRDTVAGGAFATLVVLDPSRIVGRTRASLATGFTDIPGSRAELYCIRLPSPIPYEEIHQNARIIEMQSPGSDGFTLTSEIRTNDPERPLAFLFYFEFSSDLSVRSVRSQSASENAYAQLKEQGKVKGTLDRPHMDRLKAGVEYWDGTQWRTSVTRVAHGEVAGTE